MAIHHTKYFLYSNEYWWQHFGFYCTAVCFISFQSRMYYVSLKQSHQNSHWPQITKNLVCPRLLVLKTPDHFEVLRRAQQYHWRALNKFFKKLELTLKKYFSIFLVSSNFGRNFPYYNKPTFKGCHMCVLVATGTGGFSSQRASNAEGGSAIMSSNRLCVTEILKAGTKSHNNLRPHLF